jgi:predicted CoA-binding protein
MASDFETFWEKDSFAVVGHAADRRFPVLTYRGLQQLGKTVFAVDPTIEEIDGERTYPDFAYLPRPVDAVILEVPKKETRGWIDSAARAGIRNVWIHMGTETPEALALASERGLNVCYGTCAVMYVTPGFTYHSLHRWAMKVAGRY